MEQVTVCGFPITPDVCLQIGGVERELGWQIKNHGRQKYIFGSATTEPKFAPSDGTWTYYVTIGEHQLSGEDFAEFWLPVSGQLERSAGYSQPTYDYYSPRWSSDVDWHGGVTWYEKIGGLDGAPRAVKIGCDFAHLWDEGRFYCLDAVKAECFETIRQIRALYRFKNRCSWTGRCDYAENGIEHNGRWYTPDGLKTMHEA